MHGAILLVRPYIAGHVLVRPAADGHVFSYATRPMRHAHPRCLDWASVEPFLNLNTGPLEIQRVEVFDGDLGLLKQVSGVKITPSGYTLLLLAMLWSWFSPIGIRKYVRRLREEEAAYDASIRGEWPVPPSSPPAAREVQDEHSSGQEEEDPER